MLRYEKLPDKTSPSTVAGIIFIGICLGYSLAICGIISIYGLGGSLNRYFYFQNPQLLTTKEATYLGLLGIVAGVTTTMIGFLAFYMNKLSKKAYPLSKIIFIPTLLISFMVWFEDHYTNFSYSAPRHWLLATGVSVLTAGVFPFVFLSTNGAKKIHNR